MNLLDLAYWFALIFSAPYWLLRATARHKVRDAWRLLRWPGFSPTSPVVMIHAVSLGEINATRALVTRLSAARPDLQFIITSTTETGLAQGQKLYTDQKSVTVTRYPLDFSFLVRRMLDRFPPEVVVLMELELWPNFMRECKRKKIPVILINGRITDRSFNRYRLIPFLTRKMFSSLSATCAQDQEYAQRFITLGSDPATTQVTGTMKFDTAEISAHIPGADKLAADLHLAPAEKLWVCGSTGPGEEQICLDIYDKLLKEFPDLRLAIIPRKPERFDEVAALIQSKNLPLLRRSQNSPPLDDRPIILGDTMGELRKFYSLATVVFVGRTLLDQGERQRGSDMIEPAALAKPTIVGPFTQNFREPMNAFRKANAILEVHTPDELEKALAQLLRHPTDLGARAQQVVSENQGATAKHTEIILQQLGYRNTDERR